MGFFDLPFINRVRRNHGLEHATIHILSQRHNNLSLVGRSDWDGFTIYGTIDTTELKQAAQDALHRLQQGQAELAVHPRCGTVLATTGLLTGLAAFFAISLDGTINPDSSGRHSRFRWAAIPAAILGATFAAVFAQPLGLYLQEQYTVSGEPGNLEITGVRLQSDSGLIIHRVETTQ